MTKEVDRGNQVDAVYLDFSKAFDSVNHSLLLHKLSHYGIVGPLHTWFKSYLTDRYQRVVINGNTSSWAHVTSGVPQGSILGPTLFIMFINDIVSHVKYANISLYADDSKIFHSISSTSDCHQLQSDLCNIVKWCRTWKLNLNIGKCQIISFSTKFRIVEFTYRLGMETVKRVNIVKDLGVFLNSKLNFNVHVNFIVGKAFKMFGFLKRTCKTFTNVTALRLLYLTLVRSQLDYCSQVWSHHQQYLTHKLERVQIKFVKFLCCKSNTPYSSDQYHALCKYFSLPTLTARRKMSDLSFLHKCLNNFYKCTYIISEIPFYFPSRVLRNYDFFRVSSCRLNIRKFSYIPRTCTLFNKTILD